MLFPRNYGPLLARAKDPNTSLEELDELADSEFYHVRYWVTRNHNVSVEILGKLSEETNYYVVYGVATSPNVTDGILRKLVQNKDPQYKDPIGAISKAAAEHPNASEITRRLYIMTVTQLS